MFIGWSSGFRKMAQKLIGWEDKVIQIDVLCGLNFQLFHCNVIRGVWKSKALSDVQSLKQQTLWHSKNLADNFVSNWIGEPPYFVLFSLSFRNAPSSTYCHIIWSKLLTAWPAEDSHLPNVTGEVDRRSVNIFLAMVLFCVNIITTYLWIMIDVHQYVIIHWNRTYQNQ